MDRNRGHHLGERAIWGGVGYVGVPHAPASETYAGLDAMSTDYATVADGGERIGAGAIPGNLHPLIAAALWDVAFALEAGALTTWSN